MVEKTIHLLSSGLDSPVAAHALIDAGLEPVLLFFDAVPYNTEKTRDTAIKLGKKLSQLAGKPLDMYKCPHGPTIQAFQEIAEGSEIKYTCIFCKRMFYRVAKALAMELGVHAISSGEIIGEQASQTPENLALIQECLGDFLVLRPLLCMDKQAVIKLAHELGTYPISTEAAREECLAVPRYPSTRGNRERYFSIEDKLDIQDIVDRVLQRKIKIPLDAGNHD